MRMLTNRIIQMLAACLAGFLGVMFGLGGGIVLVPVLLYTGVNARETIATSLSIISIVALSGTIHHLHMDTLVINDVNVVMMLTGIAGAVMGAMLLRITGNRLLTYALIVYFYLSGIFLILSPSIISLSYDPLINQDLSWTAGLPVATASSMLGIGGGAILTPVLLYIFQINIREIVGITMPFMFFTALTASLINMRNKFIDISAFVVMLPAAILGTFIAYNSFYLIDESHIKMGIGLILFINATVMTSRYLLK